MRPRSLPALALGLTLTLLFTAPMTRAVADASPSIPHGTAAQAAAVPETSSSWTARITRLIGPRAVSVAVGRNGTFLYRHEATTRRAPASNEKLLLSMAILDELGPGFTISTNASAATFQGGVVAGDLWILGHGDPTVDKARLSALAHRLVAAGLTQVTGSVRGSVGYFRHDWWAPGWRRSFPGTEVSLPTALTFDGNRFRGRATTHPELLAAKFLTKRLRDMGVRVAGKARAGVAPQGLTDIASITSPPLAQVLHAQNVWSINWYAEELGKLLGATASGAPGTIAKGAAAIDGFAAGDGVSVSAFDSSGLSYDDRVTAQGLVDLMWKADVSSWGTALRASLPKPGQGTLAFRLPGLTVRAKTGTLTSISALSGWVRLQDGRWAEFSILDRGMPKSRSIFIEDRIVGIVANSAA